MANGMQTSEASYALELNYLSQPFAIAAILAGKISVALMILRMIKRSYLWTRRLLWAVIVTCVAIFIISYTLFFAQCHPLKAWWTSPLMVKTNCWDMSVGKIFGVFSGSE